MNKDRISVLSFDVRDEAIVVHEFDGEVSFRAQDGSDREIPCINHLAITEGQLRGMPIQGFLDIVLTLPFEVGYNKHVAVAVLNTWVWAQVVGDNGVPRGKPRMFRHVMPDGGTPFWVLKKNQGRGYSLVPLREFSCRFCGQEFERYEGQELPDRCQECDELVSEHCNLAHELLDLDELDEQVSDRGREVAARMAEIEAQLGWA